MKTYLVSAGVALLVVVLGFAFFGPSENVIVQRVVEIVKRLGAIPGNELQGPCIIVNGLSTCYAEQPMQVASSTLCVFQTPEATSTLARFSGKLTQSTSTSVGLVLQSHLTSAFAPSLSVATSVNSLGTLELAASVASGTTVMYNSTTTSLQSNPTHVLPPNTFVAFFAKYGGSGSINQAGRGQVYQGQCTAVFQEL